MTDIFYKTAGQGQALVLLHSGGMTHQEWQPQLSALSEKFAVYTPDLPGHGQSINHKSLSIKNIAESLIEWLDELSLTRTHLVGSSLGGAIALYMALHYPKYIDKLVIYRIGYNKGADTFNETQSMADPTYWQKFGLDRYLSKQHLAQGGEAAWKTVIANVAKLLDPTTSDHAHELTDLAKIQAETLVVSGDRDPLIPVETAVEMYRTIPQSALLILPNASHITATNTWRAEFFCEEIIRFLNKK